MSALKENSDNDISPLAFVHPGAKLGSNNKIGPFCYIGPRTVIGDNNEFVSYVSIGTKGQHVYEDSLGVVRIGSGNTFREFVTVHEGLELKPTVILDDCYFGTYSHIAHNSYIENEVVMMEATIGGWVHVMQGAYLALKSVIHPRQVIGSYSMIGMGTVVPKMFDILPCQVYAGNPAKCIGRNEVGIKRHFIDEERIKTMNDLFRSYAEKRNEHWSRKGLK